MIGADVAAGARVLEVAMGRRAMAVGQQAKVAVAEARGAGNDLPKNAQGLAASEIARGADAAAVFEALVTSQDAPEGVTPEPVAGPVDDNPEASQEESLVAQEEGSKDAPVVDDDAGGPAALVGEPDPGPTLDGAETAIALLEEALDQR